MNNIDIIRNKDPAIKLVSEMWCRGILDYADYCDRWCKLPGVVPLPEEEYVRLWDICQRDYNLETGQEKVNTLSNFK